MRPSTPRIKSDYRAIMRPFRQVVGLTAVNLFSHSFASSLQPDTVDCETVTTGLSSSCWDQLNVNTWMQNWMVTTSPNATNGAAAQCKDNELWSTCFLRLGLEVTGRDCFKIGTNGGNSTCPMPRLGYPPHDPHMFYGVWNIYGTYLLLP